MALITVLYLFGIAVLDNYLFYQKKNFVETIILLIISIVIFISIIFAQFGLNFEKHQLLYPIFIVQVNYFKFYNLYKLLLIFLLF